jgi:hypothetical protein
VALRRTIVCLANSYKHGGRCVAGICLESHRWIRLRGAADDGALSVREYTLTGGAGELRLLDVFEVDLHYPIPSDCHPEDWATMPMAWRLIERPCSPERWKQVVAAEDRTTGLLGGSRDRISAAELLAKPAKSSLSLISPDDLHWWIREKNGERKKRALFQRHHVTYNLSVTDPAWLAQLNLLPAGIYPHRMLAPDAKQTWLTISLSEAFAPGGVEPWHFRIVAAVIAL